MFKKINHINSFATKIIFQFYSKDILQSSKLKETDNHTQHGSTSCFWHSVAVAYYSLKFTEFLGIKCDVRSLIRGALLHDYFLYDWHEDDDSHKWHGFKHPKIALENAVKDFEINSIEKNIISRHMFPLTLMPPKYKESNIVCLIDKLCSIYEIFCKPITYSKLRKLYT